ncbi:DUF86 domain-containing protein [candidate division KSB1 bacterium]|nr:DUF86 domain-containing protein [candidate division KSB1 bacterium]
MVKTTVLYRKIDSVRHNLKRLQQKLNISLQNFLTDEDAQEIVLLNLQHAIQGCIDIGTHIVSDENWGVPGSISEIFYSLEEHKIIPTELVERLIPMAGFRNLIVHQYQDIDFNIVYLIYQNRLSDISDFLTAIQEHYPA